MQEQALNIDYQKEEEEEGENKTRWKQKSERNMF